MTKIALVSTILNHGGILEDVGTELSLGLSRIEDVEIIEVLTTMGNCNKTSLPNKVVIHEIYDPFRPWTYLNLYLKLCKSDYDLIVYNAMPTSQGKGIFSNSLFLVSILFSSTIIGKRTLVLYHNSPFVSDYDKLGYKSFLDHIKAFFLRMIEKLIFKNTETFMLLRYYSTMINQILRRELVSFINLPYLGAFTSLYLNSLLEKNTVDLSTTSSNPINVLLYGSWGPQKDLGKALEAIRQLKSLDKKYRITLAGSVNSHFPKIRDEFELLKAEFKEYLDLVIDYVPSNDIFSLFLKNDIIVLPYKVSGGFSAVMALARFFKILVVVPKFNEFVEQAREYGKVRFIPTNFTSEDIFNAVINSKIEIKGSIKPQEDFKVFSTYLESIFGLGAKR